MPLRKLFLLAALLLSAFAGAQSALIWDANTTYHFGDVVYFQSTRCYYRSLVNQTTSHANPNYDHLWEVYEVPNGVTLQIPVRTGAFDLYRAWAYIKSARATGTGQIVLKIHNLDSSTYSYTMTGAFPLDHPYGDHISIVGDGHASALFTFPSGTDGFTLSNGHSIESISGLSVIGQGHTSSGTGINVQGGACSLSDVSVQSFDTAVGARGTSQINVGTGLTASNCRVGLYARSNGVILCSQPVSVDTAGISNSYGYLAGFNGFVSAEYSTAKNSVYGYFAEFNGLIDAKNSVAQGETGVSQYGFVATRNALIWADQSTSSSNSQFDYAVASNGYIEVQQVLGNSTMSTNYTSATYPGFIERRT